MPSSKNSAVAVEHLSAGYRGRPVVHDLTLSVRESEILVVLGHNGAGKSTVLRAVVGQAEVYSGDVTLFGRSMRAWRRHHFRRRGVAYAPQGGRVFGGLTVGENLEFAAGAVMDRPDVGAAVRRATALFPQIAAHLRQRAETLSGGEREMVALASCLVQPAPVLLLDEPTIGLSPQARSRFFATLASLVQAERSACILVEQHAREALSIAQSAIVLRQGKVTYEGPAATLSDAVLRELLIV